MFTAQMDARLCRERFSGRLLVIATEAVDFSLRAKS